MDDAFEAFLIVVLFTGLFICIFAPYIFGWVSEDDDVE